MMMMRYGTGAEGLCGSEVWMCHMRPKVLVSELGTHALVIAQSHGLGHGPQLSKSKARATGFGKPCKKPGLAWLFMAGFGWLKPPGQSRHINIHKFNHIRKEWLIMT
jgi:hypothetical protein